MRLIAKSTIVNFYTTHPAAEGSLKAFVEELKSANWKKPSDVIADYPTADVITGKRFVINIKGNSFRLVIDIEFIIGHVYIVWFGTHAEYDKTDVKAVKYVKSNQNRK